MPPELAVVFPSAGVTGGVERVALDLVRFQTARRSTCFVGQAIDAPGLDLRFVDVPRVPTWLRPIAFRRAAARRLRDVEAGTTLSFGVNCPPGDVYWVHSVHASWLENGGDIVYRGVHVPPWIRRLLLRHQVILLLERAYFARGRPRAIICTSQREVDDLARLYGVARDRMHVLPNGYDGTLFSLERRSALRNAMRTKLGAQADDIVILMVANEWHRKGLGVLLEALARLDDPRVRIDLVGARPPDDYRPVAQRLGLSERFHWHGPSSDVPEYYAGADVFALPTTYEPFGLVIIEAMAMGLPVVASKLAGASDAITHGANGLVLDNPRDPDELAAALAIAVSSDGARLGTAAAVSVGSYEWNEVLTRADRIIFPD